MLIFTGLNRIKLNKITNSNETLQTCRQTLQVVGFAPIERQAAAVSTVVLCTAAATALLVEPAADDQRAERAVDGVTELQHHPLQRLLTPL